MSNRSMDRRVATLVADAQNLERLGCQDIDLGLTTQAAGRFIEAADTLTLALCHMTDRKNDFGCIGRRDYSRREAMRHINRLHAKAKRLNRRGLAFARSLGVSHWIAT